MTGRLRRLLLPGAMTACMLVLLCALGSWQVHRLAWKTALLADIARAEANPAVPLPAAPPPFIKVRVTGTLRPNLFALYGAEVRDTPTGPGMGGRLIAVLDRTDGPPLLVDRGWVPTTRAASVATPAGMVTIEGYIREPDHAGLFTVHDDPVARRFFTLDPAAIGAALGLERTAPFLLVALGPRPPELFPEPAHALPRPPNDHLGYALTWYGLALVLLAVFLLYCRKALRP